MKSAGLASSETLTGAPLIVESLLKSSRHREIDQEELAVFEEVAGSQLQIRQLRQAYAIIEGNHVHVGLLYPESLAFIGPILASAKKVCVAYEDGAAWIYTPVTLNAPAIEAPCDYTVWDLVESDPSRICGFTLYVLRDGRLQGVCTKPAFASMFVNG